MSAKSPVVPANGIHKLFPVLLLRHGCSPSSLPHQTGDPRDHGASVLPEGETWSQPEMGM